MRTGDSDNNKGGEGEVWYKDNVVDGKKCDEEGQEEVGNNNGGEENNSKKKPPPQVAFLCVSGTQ